MTVLAEMMNFAVITTLIYIQLKLVLLHRDRSTCQQFLVRLLGETLSRWMRIIPEPDSEEEDDHFIGNSIEQDERVLVQEFINFGAPMLWENVMMDIDSQIFR